MNTNIEVLCGTNGTHEDDLLSVNITESSPFPLTSFTSNFSLGLTPTEMMNESRETWINYTIEYPFEGSVATVPVSCNQTDTFVTKNVHPSQIKSAYFLTGVAALSSICSFLLTYTYLNNDRFTHRQTLLEMLITFFLTFLWVASTVSWCSGVTQIKHFGNFFMYYTSICNDPMAECIKSVDGTWCRLHLSIIIGFANCFIWFCWTAWKFYAHLSVLFYYFPGEPKFTRIDHPNLRMDRDTSISTIEDKIEYEREGFFDHQILRESNDDSDGILSRSASPPALLNEETTVVLVNPHTVTHQTPSDLMMIIRFQSHDDRRTHNRN